jgi:hypothetical protein
MEDEMVKLKNLKWSPKWVSHLGCLKGCLDYLGIEMTDAWLYGGTGHAFIINISEDSCPSGPTAWRTEMLYQAGEALGYQVEGVFGWKRDEGNFGELKAEAWEFTRSNLDEGNPVYGWELEIPEFYVINGYDEVGYYYSGAGADEGGGPKPWNELGETGIGMVEVYRVKASAPASDREIVKSAIENVLKHARNPEEWVFEKYASGTKGFDLWISGLTTGKAGRFGMGYNAAVWHECRRLAVDFLQEASARLAGEAGDLFEQAADQYRLSAESLEKVVQRYPFRQTGPDETIPVDANSLEAASWLKEARQAETAGLALLEKIHAVL